MWGVVALCVRVPARRSLVHPDPSPSPRSPADRRPDVPPTLVAQPGAALAGRGQSSPLRGCSTSPQPLDREPLLQDAAAPRGCRRPRRPPLCVPGGRGWERGRHWQLCGLPPPHCSPLGLPPLRLPTHATQRSVSRPQHHWGCLPSLLLRRGGCGPGGGQGRRQIPGVTDREHEDGKWQSPAPRPGCHGHPACHTPPNPDLPLLCAGHRPRLQQRALPPRRLPGWPGLQLHP